MTPVSREDEHPDEIVTGGVPWVLQELEDGTQIATSLWVLTEEERAQVAACGTIVLGRYQSSEDLMPRYLLMPGEEKGSPWYQHGNS